LMSKFSIERVAYAEAASGNSIKVNATNSF